MGEQSCADHRSPGWLDSPVRLAPCTRDAVVLQVPGVAGAAVAAGVWGGEADAEVVSSAFGEVEGGCASGAVGAF